MKRNEGEMGGVLRKLRRFVLAPLCAAMLLVPDAAHAKPDETLTFKDVRVLFIDKKDCDTCETVSNFLSQIAHKDTWMNVQTMHLETSDEAQRIQKLLLSLFGIETMEFPIVVVGSHAVMGYIDHRTTGMEIIGYANYCRFFECADILEAIEQDDGTTVNVMRPHRDAGSVLTAEVRTFGSDARDKSWATEPWKVCQADEQPGYHWRN